MSTPTSQLGPAAPIADPADIAVVGMACRFPGATDPEAFWRNLRDAVVSIAPLAEADLVAEGVPRELFERPEYVRAAPLLDGIDLFDASFFGFTGREAALLDPQQRLFLECAWEALESAGFDPARAGRVGVYAGAGMSAYLMSNLLGGGRLLMSASGFELQIHNDKDYLSSRTAYKLGLTGPAVSVQTACSSSLVSVHQACQALQSYECDAALAGAACVRVPHRVGYLYEAGLMFSPDGSCRPFDADAAGTVFGSGVGVVALRRLADALADGDTVLAVIKATATNNDGTAKVGFTAPSVDGQAEVIATALELAGIDAATVSAVEAHGTGTPLGDPIEVTALTRTFRAHTEDSGFCALSSVKGNVGHLEAAAGMASLIKAVLQLRHRQLAPTANFHRPNPQLVIEQTPFRITEKLTDWTASGAPLRIGVSSFGIGGTNAHLILQEPPEPARTNPPVRERQLITVSAKTPQALEGTAQRLAAHFGSLDAAQSAPERFADAVHTLHTGRHPFRFRRTVVADSCAEAAALLGGEHPELVATADAGDPPSDVVFLFPGQGAQYAGMSRGLYHCEPGFRSRLDECAELLRPHLGLDLREVLYADDSGEGAARITATGLAQPALFCVEYALAGLLADFGVEPTAMVGHSVGELTAACLAGVLELPDALRLVAVRGRIMQEQPSGAMLSVAAPEERVRTLLPPGVDIAAVNAPALCVASGPEEMIAAAERALAGQDIGRRRLHTSHAFHSSMMDPVVGPFTEEVRRIRLAAPRRPFTSDVTGTWISDEQATDPAYWGSHARKPVRFADAVATASVERAVFIEVGPGNTLASLTRQTVAAESRAAVLTTLPHPDERRPDSETLLTGLGGLWLAGIDLDWQALHGGRRGRVPLPTYPFQRQRYWVEPRGTGSTADLDVIAPAEPSAAEAAELAARPQVLTAHAPARNEDERVALALWEELFGFADLGIHDNFFELGGHSLLATRMLGRYRELTGRSLTLSELLAAPTVAGMVATARAAGDGPSVPQVVPDLRHRFDPFPLTEMQQAQWIGRLGNFDLGGVAAHVYLEFDSEGLDLPRAERAWQQVVDRHDILRVVVLPDGRQRVVETVTPYRIPTLDLRQADPATADEQLAAVRGEMEAEVRPADTWPLWEIRATRLPGDRTRLHISFDLIVADVAGFFFQLLPEWGARYADPHTRPEPLELSFRDYVLAEQQMRKTPDYERALEYWRRRVAELPPAPELPVRASGRPAPTRFARWHTSVPPELWQRIRAQATEHGITASTALIAAYAAVIGTWSKSQHFTLNLTAVDRLPVHEQVREIVGEFASFDLLEVDLRSAADFAALARQVQQRSWQDFEHRQVSGVRVLRELARERGGSGGAAMPVVVTSSLTEGEDRGDTGFTWLGEQTYFISQTPQVTLDHFIMEVGGNLELAWHALEGYFPEGMLDDMFDAYRTLVVGLADPARWSAVPCPELPPHQAASRAEANRTARPAPRGLLTDGILRCAGDPDLARRPALIARDRTLTHAELAGRTVALAQHLASRGYGKHDVIGVSLPKGWQQVVAALGASAAGALYVPIDPDLPEARRRWLIEHAGVTCLLTGDNSTPFAEVETIAVPDAVAAPQDITGWRCPARDDDVAYVIYTSGSTGTPKGVAITHRAALNTIDDINERFRVGPDDMVLGLSSLSFDLSVYDVFGVLGAGGALVLPEPEARRDPARWLELVQAHRITLWNSVPALMQMFVEHAEAVGAAELPLRLALLSGDWIPTPLPDRIRGMATAEVVSLGGATEASIWSIAYPIGEVHPEWTSIPYGRPLGNQRFLVLNERMEPAPVWVPGQLYIAGDGLAYGYWNDAERTAESFFPHPLTGERLYRTGDLGRYLPDGTLEFLGREDFQVKVGGFRIELGEIEQALAELAGVRHSAVAALGPRHQQRLVAYLVPEPAADGDLVERARQRLAETLPSYMYPSDYVLLEALPLSSNGKVDRAALPEPERHGGRQDTPDETDAALQETATRLAAIAAELLGMELVGPGDNFFELGGDSILGIQLVARANAQGLALTPQDVFAANTIVALAAACHQSDEADVAQRRSALTAHQRTLALRGGGAGADPVPGWLRYEVEGDFDPALAEAALGELMRRHLALRLRVGGGPQGAAQWAGDSQDCYVPDIDLRSLPEATRQTTIRSMVDDMAGELDLAAGPVIKLALIKAGDDRALLVWVASRALLDDASWPRLIHDFHSAYAQLAAGATVRWESPAGDFLEWADTAAAGGGLEPATAEVHALDGEFLSELTAEELGRATYHAHRAYRLEPHEVLLTALARALGQAGGALARAAVVAERSSRPKDGTGHQLISALGRFTELAVLPHPRSGDPRDTALAVKGGYRTPASAIPSGPQVLVRETARWTDADPAPAELPWPDDRRDRPAAQLVEITPALVDGALRLRWWYAPEAEEAVRTAAADLPRQLAELAAHFEENPNGTFHASDFPLVGLTDADLEQFIAGLGDH